MQTKKKQKLLSHQIKANQNNIRYEIHMKDTFGK